jgi:hypothetical protein
MYGHEVREAALKMRRDGVQVKVVAKQLGVSDGWASMATAGARDADENDRLLSAADVPLSRDASEHGKGRERRLAALSSRRKQSVQGRLDELVKAVKLDDVWCIPRWSSSNYKVLDRFQQMFARDAEHPMFGMMDREWPEMLSHLVEWKRVRRSPDKSEEGFMEMAIRVHDYVASKRKGPSIADKDIEVQEAARWLWRWKCNANGRLGRKRNVERSEIFTEIGIIVEMIMSPVPSVHALGCESIDNGRWNSLFSALLENRKGSSSYIES